MTFGAGEPARLLVRAGYQTYHQLEWYLPVTEAVALGLSPRSIAVRVSHHFLSRSYVRGVLVMALPVQAISFAISLTRILFLYRLLLPVRSWP